MPTSSKPNFPVASTSQARPQQVATKPETTGFSREELRRIVAEQID